MPELNLLMERASLLLQQKRYRDAEIVIRQVLEQEPRNERALSLLGRCYLNSKRLDEGIAVVQQAISVNPNNSFYFYLLGYGYYHKHQKDPAIANLKKAISLYPYEGEYFGLLSFILIEQNLFEEALDYANQGLATDAENITCLNARSTALNKLRRTEDAIDTMQDALAQDPDNEMTHATAGWNFLEKGKHKEAEKHFMEALRINPNYTSARAGLKEALKSRIPPYKWLLQYSFWIRTKSRGIQRALPIILYVVFRMLIAIFQKNDATEDIALALGGLYILLLILSWTINPLANFFLLFHNTGKYALTNTEKWASINVFFAMIAGIALMLIAGLTNLVENTPYVNLFIAGMVCLSLALPLGRINYPIRLGKENKDWMLPALLVTGVASLLVFAVAPAIAVTLFVIYGGAFVIYSWIGIFR
jgi:tetratricopeptide (TPR) repeat protein